MRPFSRLLLISLLAIPAIGRGQTVAAISGDCKLGAAQAQTQGLHSTNFQLGVVPNCTVRVVLTGTSNLATIYADGSLTPKGNPFTLQGGSASWLFFAAINQGYDVILSGGTFPNTFPAPVTLVGLYPAQQIIAPGGGGTVSGQTPASIPLATSATALTKPSPLSVDDVNTPTLITSTVSITAPGATLTTLGISSAPICPNGAGGALTTSGCTVGSGTVSGQANGVIPLATGASTIAAQSHLDDGVSNPNIITASRGVYANINKVISVIAPPYNAKCDGTTDDQAAIQAAFTAAASSAAQVQFPAGTCYTATPIVWKGQSFFGAGRDITVVQGGAGYDVFQTPDNTTNALATGASVHDLTILVDVSVDSSATAAGGNNRYPNRIAGTVQNLTAFTRAISPSAPVFGVGLCAGHGLSGTAAGGGSTNVTISCSNFPLSYAIASLPTSMVIGQPITINGAGSAGGTYSGTISAIVTGCVGATSCTFTVTPAISTTVSNASGSFLNALTPPWYIGNAGIAFQCSTGGGSNCTPNAQSYTFSNIKFDRVNGGSVLYGNHCAAIFTQVALYAATLSNIDTEYLYAGYIEAAPISGSIATPDTSRFTGLDLHDILPLVTYNGNSRTFTNLNIYQEYPFNLGPFFLTNNQTSGGNATWTIDSPYMEGGPSVAGEYARFMSGMYNVRAANFGQGISSQGYVEYAAFSGSWDGFMGGSLTVDGSLNKFRNLNMAKANITNNGQGNEIRGSIQTGTINYQGREFNNDSRPFYDPVGKQDGSFLLSGNSATPYTNANDNLTHCADWALPSNPANSATASCVVDGSGTEITRSYMQSAGATTTIDFLNNGGVTNIWSGRSRTFGTEIPQVKGTFYVLGQCVGTATCSATFLVKDGTANSTITSGSIALTSSWTLQSLVSDLSGTTYGNVLDFRFQGWTNAGTNYRIAFVAFQGDDVDEHRWLYTNGLPVSSSVNLLAASTSGVLCTGPSSGIVSGHIATFNGTNCNLQDGGAVPAAVQTAVPLWLQSYGDGSEGAYSCPSGTCDLQTGEHWYTTCNITAGAIVDAKSTTLSAGAPLILRCSTSATIAGTISYSINTGSSNGNPATALYGGGSGGGGFGASNGTIGNGYIGAVGAGAAGTSGVSGGAGTATPIYVQKIFLSSGLPYTGTACGGPVGGAGQGGVAAGRGGGCIVIISPSINFTGTCDVSGQNGTAGGVNTGAGGGGAGGICLMRSPSMTNSGTMTVTGGTGGAIGTGTSTAGGNGATGWSKVYTQ